MSIIKTLSFITSPVEVDVTTIEKNSWIGRVLLVGNVEISLSFFELVKVIVSQTSIIEVYSTIWVLLDGFPILSQSILIFSTFKI